MTCASSVAELAIQGKYEIREQLDQIIVMITICI
jgi:hypothetical protein